MTKQPGSKLLGTCYNSSHQPRPEATMDQRRTVCAALFGALTTALFINLAVLITAKSTGGGVSHEEERILAITVGTALVLGVASVAALVYAKSRR